MRQWLLRCLRRPSLWVALVTAVAYWDGAALRGKFVYDDGGSVKQNVVVNGQARPLFHELFRRDFWGTPLSEPQSHKSFRPVTTLTFRLNWLWEQRRQQQQHNEENGSQKDDNGASTAPTTVETTYSFHLVNLLLHCIVTALVTETAAFVFTTNNNNAHGADAAQQEDVDTTTPQLITGFIFGLHPVHVEAVTNITSRGELLMSLFFLTAFLVYARHIPSSTKGEETTKNTGSSVRTTMGLYLVPWVCMVLSVFSKEQGATALMTCVAYDFVQNHSSVREYWGALRRREPRAVAMARRTFLLAVETVTVVLWRYWLNGETSPDFIFDQNPAGFSRDRFTRAFSVAWVYCLYVRDALWPLYLGPDWSGLSIDLIEEWSDRRTVAVLALWTVAGVGLCSLLFGPSQSSGALAREIRRVGLMAFFAFMFIPFLLSSNLLVVVGLMKADRVIYLPLLGFALLEALLFNSIFGSLPMQGKNASLRASFSLPTKYVVGLLLVLVQLLFYSVKLHERNIAWSEPLRLWLSAYQINSRSRHTIYNAGYELSLKKRYREAEQVLRPIGSPRVEGPSNTFVYAMVLFNLNRCDEARPLIDDAMVVVEEKRKTGGPRNTEANLKRVKSNLLVAQGFCTPDLAQSGKTMYEAVQADPTNQYAVDQAMQVVRRLEAMGQLH